MLESPGGSLWLKDGTASGYRQTRAGTCRLPCLEAEHRRCASFLQSSGWVVNLEEFRSYPRRYGRWCCRPGCRRRRRPGWWCR
jgi:hypothetical protein